MQLAHDLDSGDAVATGNSADAHSHAADPASFLAPSVSEMIHDRFPFGYSCCGLVGSVLAAGPFWCGVLEGRADHARSLFS